jgi:hypothetical protein
MSLRGSWIVGLAGIGLCFAGTAGAADGALYGQLITKTPIQAGNNPVQTSPIPNAAIKLCPKGAATTSALCRGGVTASDGYFYFSDVPVGDFDLIVGSKTAGRTAVGSVSKSAAADLGVSLQAE